MSEYETKMIEVLGNIAESLSALAECSADFKFNVELTGFGLEDTADQIATSIDNLFNKN